MFLMQTFDIRYKLYYVPILKETKLNKHINHDQSVYLSFVMYMRFSYVNTSITWLLRWCVGVT